MMSIEFRNGTDLAFTDISSELWREYTFPSEGGVATVVKISSPTHLNVSKSGGHRIFDDTGISHYVPSGWVLLRWQAKPDSPHFVA